MGDTAVPDNPPGRHEVAVTTAAPVMPQPLSGTVWPISAYLIVRSGQRYSLGWMDTRKDGPCFVVARITALGEKVLDRFPLTEDGWAQAWAALVKLDARAAQAVAGRLQEWRTEKAQLEGQDQVFDAFVKAGGATVFRWLGVQVLEGDGTVYTIGTHDPAAQINTARLLGSLAGAQAVVTDGSQAWSPGRAMFLPISLAGLATKTKADAAVVFPDGTAHLTPLDGNTAVREAQRQAVQFNALVNAAAPAATASTSDPAVRLRKLQELRDTGLITQEEYEAKRAEVINSI